MGLDIHASKLGTASPRSHPYAPSLSSSASSSTSSVFSDVASQASTSSSSTSNSIPSGWESEEWSATSRLAAAAAAVDTFAPISRVNTYPQYQPSLCRETVPERVLPSLRTAGLVLPAEQRQHPRRSSSTIQRPPPQLQRQVERKVNFVDCLVG